jgi:hypothetical protein
LRAGKTNLLRLGCYTEASALVIGKFRGSYFSTVVFFSLFLINGLCSKTFLPDNGMKKRGPEF